MYQLDATIYYDFILTNSLYMFRTFTCPSSGVLIYRLFTAACGVMPCEKHDEALADYVSIYVVRSVDLTSTKLNNIPLNTTHNIY